MCIGDCCLYSAVKAFERFFFRYLFLSQVIDSVRVQMGPMLLHLHGVAISVWRVVKRQEFGHNMPVFIVHYHPWP